MTPSLPPGKGSALLLIGNFGLGGAERQLFYLAMGLRRHGWDVAVASMSPLVHPPFAEALSEAGITLTVLQHSMSPTPLAMVRALRAARRLVRLTRPTAMIGFMPHGVLFARLLGRLGGVRHIVSSLRSVKSTQPWHDRLLAASKFMDHAQVVNSVAARDAQLASGVVTAEKCVVIHNGFEIEPPIRNPAARATRAGVFTWLLVAVFRTEKGHANLLRAARIVAARRPFRLLLAGEGPQLEAMKTLAAELDVLEVVEFLGKRTDVPDLLAEADGFVLPSMWEGSPNALIEALAAGLPAVATEVGGCPEVLHEGVSGFLVPPEDPQALADAMIRLMDLAPEVRARMGAAGQAHVSSTFSMEAMVDDWERLIGSAERRAAAPAVVSSRTVGA